MARAQWMGGTIDEKDIFNANAMKSLTRKIIEEAYSVGNCVIVSREAPCILAVQAQLSFMSLSMKR